MFDSSAPELYFQLHTTCVETNSAAILSMSINGKWRSWSHGKTFSSPTRDFISIDQQKKENKRSLVVKHFDPGRYLSHKYSEGISPLLILQMCTQHDRACDRNLDKYKVTTKPVLTVPLITSSIPMISSCFFRRCTKWSCCFVHRFRFSQNRAFFFSSTCRTQQKKNRLQSKSTREGNLSRLKTSSGLDA